MKRVLCGMLMLMMGIGLLTGCGDKELSDEEYAEIAEQKAQNDKKVVALYATKGSNTYEITMNDVVYFLAYNELQGYQAYAEKKEEYEAVFGEGYDFWETQGADGTMGDVYKGMAFSTIAYTYVFYYEAVEEGMKLDAQRTAQLDAATENFLAKYTPAQRARCGMTAEGIRATYERIFLADAYMEKLTAEHVVDEEAVTATVDKEDYLVYVTDYLYVPKADYDDDLKQIELTENELAERKAAIEDALTKVEKGQEMLAVRAIYDKFMTYATRDFYRTNATYEEEYIEKAVAMEVGENALLETKSGYYVIKLIDNTQYAGYDEAVKAAIEDAKNLDISKVYTELEKEYDISTSEAWDAVKFGNYIMEKKEK